MPAPPARYPHGNSSRDAAAWKTCASLTGTALPSLPRPLVQLHLLNNHAKHPNFEPAQAADPWCSSSAGVTEGEDLCHSSWVTPANPCQPALVPEDKPGMSDLGGCHKTPPETARACAARSTALLGLGVGTRARTPLERAPNTRVVQKNRARNITNIMKTTSTTVSAQARALLSVTPAHNE